MQLTGYKAHASGHGEGAAVRTAQRAGAAPEHAALRTQGTLLPEGVHACARASLLTYPGKHGSASA